MAAYGDRVRYSFVEEHSKIFHRTKRLNECLKQVETPVTIIHDVDVILPVASMLEAQRMIMEEGYGAVAPFTNPPGCTDVPQKDADLLVSDVSTHERLAVIHRTHFAGNGFSLSSPPDDTPTGEGRTGTSCPTDQRTMLACTATRDSA